jgi:hypothetical protein
MQKEYDFFSFRGIGPLKLGTLSVGADDFHKYYVQILNISFFPASNNRWIKKKKLTGKNYEKKEISEEKSGSYQSN